jgi:SulP family sulfate permease
MGFTIALVGYAQSIAIAKSIQAKHKNYVINANQELVALGMANVGAAFCNGFPVAGGFSRSAVNDAAGGKTALSSMISAIMILLTLAFFTHLFYYLPLAILAAVVLVAVSGLIDIKAPFDLWKKDRSDFAMWGTTFLATLAFGIEMGILSGMGLSLLMVIYKASRPHMAQLGRVPGTTVYRNIKRFNNLEIVEDLLIVRLDGPIYFANVDYIKDNLDHWLEDRKGKIQSILFNMESVISLDSTGVHALATWLSDWRDQGIDLYLTGAKGPVRDVLNRWGLIERIGAEHMFMDDQTAVEYVSHRLDKEKLRKHVSYSTQSNIRKKD